MFGRMHKPRQLQFFLQKETRPFCSSSASFLRHQPLSSSSSSYHSSTPPSNVNNVSWARRLLKFGLFTALTGAVGGAAYSTFAYTLEEVEYKTKGFKDLTTYTVEDTAPTLEKFRASLYSAAMTVPAKSIELYLNLRRSFEEQIWEHAKFLPPMHPQCQQARLFTLVLDLDETLIFSDWQRERGWRTFKRPGLDAFLERLALYYEIVIYTDQPSSYADPIIQKLNKGHIHYALSRSATRYRDGHRYRDLSKLNRDPSRIIYVSGHALESTLQPENSVPVKAWKLEADDTSLSDLIPFLEYVGSHRPDDIRKTLESYKGCDIASEFRRRSKEHRPLNSIWRR